MAHFPQSTKVLLMKEESSGMCLLDYLHRAETFSSLGVGQPREPIPYYLFHQDHRHKLLLVITSFKTRPTHSRTGSWHLCMPLERWRHSSTCSNKQNTCDINLLKSLLHTWHVLYNLHEDCEDGFWTLLACMWSHATQAMWGGAWSCTRRGEKRTGCFGAVPCTQQWGLLI